MVKNSHIHLFVETCVKDRVKQEAKEFDISMSELCRQKINRNHPLNKIDLRLERIEKKLNSKLTKKEPRDIVPSDNP